MITDLAFITSVILATNQISFTCGSSYYIDTHGPLRTRQFIVTDYKIAKHMLTSFPHNIGKYPEEIPAV